MPQKVKIENNLENLSMKKSSFISPACGWKFQIKIGRYQKIGDLLTPARTKEVKLEYLIL